MKDLIRTFDDFPKIVKFILALPVLDIVWPSIVFVGQSIRKTHLVSF